MTVLGPDGLAEMIEGQDGRALEVAAGRLALRGYDPGLIREGIEMMRDYLLRHLDRERWAFFKLYDAGLDQAELRRRTIYSASGLLTLLKLERAGLGSDLDAVKTGLTSFTLSMQVSSGDFDGAFHYGLNAETGIKQDRFVVGTVAKTIFTLLELHRRGGGQALFEAAVRAGEWLVKMVQPDGRVLPVHDVVAGVTTSREQQSVLYSGQTLSALSRLTLATGDTRFADAGAAIAKRLSDAAVAAGGLLGDDHRRPNTVSTTWLAMSLLDYTAVKPSKALEDILFRATEHVLDVQHADEADLYRFGSYSGNSPSGNGWVLEVLVDVLKRARERQHPIRERIEASMRQSIRWLLQSMYTLDSSWNIQNPTRALGGLPRGPSIRLVRTDSVCHGINGMLGALELLGDDASLTLPDQLFRPALDSGAPSHPRGP